MKKKVIRISLLVGVLLFAFIIYKIGPAQIWDNIKRITWQNFLILVFLRFLYWLLRTLCWKTILEGYESNSSLLHLFAARMGSHAISQLTPTANIAGDAARVFMVNSSSKKLCIASVIVDKTIEYISVVFFTIIGAAIVITRVTLPGKYKIIFISFVFTATLLLLYITSKQKRGFLGWIIKLLGKMKITFKFLERNQEKIKETDAYISEFYQQHRQLFLQVFLLYSLLMLFWTTEIHLTLMFIGAKGITFMDSFLVVTLGTLASIFPFIPASLGVYEAAYVGIFALLGHSPDVGLTLVIIRRIIALMWAGIGLLGMMKMKPGPAPQKK